MGRIQSHRSTREPLSRPTNKRLPQTNSSSAAGVEVRHLNTLDEFNRCVELEKLVWGGEDLEIVPNTIFVVTHHTGGQVLGAFDPAAGGTMIGFTLAFPAFHGRQRFLHSHMTAVLPAYQNRGVGRQLKLFQRQDALRRGIRLVEWTFDPLELRNAYFNIVRLGAIVRRLIPNCYGVTTSPLHRGLPTDRLVAEWWLDSPRVRRAAAKGSIAAPSGRAKKKIVRIRVAANFNDLRARDPVGAEAAQRRIREEFLDWFARGYVVTGFDRDEEGAEYLLEPYASTLTNTA